MIRIQLLACLVPAVVSIIITDPPPSETDYKYSYNIEDPFTGDTKSQHEVRQGDVVTGAYSVLGPDGTKRIVEYTADSKHGFKAVLREESITEEMKQQLYQPPPTVPIAPPQEYYKTRVMKRPVRYTLVEAPSVHYVKENHEFLLFTPANEINTDKLALEHGKYFEPAV